jgi:hypothetical protein
MPHFEGLQSFVCFVFGQRPTSGALNQACSGLVYASVPIIWPTSVNKERSVHFRWRVVGAEEEFHAVGDGAGHGQFSAFGGGSQALQGNKVRRTVSAGRR